MAELRGLLGDDLQTRPRNGRIRLAGRWIGFPLRIGDLVRHLPPSFAAGAAVDALTAPVRRPRRDTFDEVVRAGLGPTMWRRFYEPYARKIWGVDPASLAGEQARRRVGADTPAKILRRVMTGQKRGPATFFYPRRGFGQIAEGLAAAATAVGVDVRCGATVEKLQPGDDESVVRTSDGQSVSARQIWSTLPLPLLAQLTDPGPPDDVLRATTALRFRSMVLVYLVLDMDQWTPYDAHYLPEPSTPVTRISEPKNYRAGDDPAGRTVLCAEIPCDLGDGVWEASESELGRLVADGIAAQQLPVVQPVDVAVRRLSHAYPIYATGYDESFRRLDAWVASLPGVLTLGRQGLFAHDNTHHALAMASAAADAWQPEGGFDGTAWAAARERFTHHVVED
jgi:protoporphyrinogen oxidase